MSDGEPTFEFGLVCEGPDDADTTRRLVRRVLRHEVEWLRDTWEYVLEWRGVDPSDAYTRWTEIKTLSKRRGIRLHGRFSGELGDGRGEALQSTKAIRLFRDARASESRSPTLEVVFLIRDSDAESGRRPAMEEARDHAAVDFAVVVGVPHTKRECWVLVTFEPDSEAERVRRDELRSELGFDPTEKAHRLTASSSGAKKNAKRVLEHLADGDRAREHRALEQMTVGELETAGEKVSLSKFVDEIRERIVPRLQDHS